MNFTILFIISGTNCHQFWGARLNEVEFDHKTFQIHDSQQRYILGNLRLHPSLPQYGQICRQYEPFILQLIRRKTMAQLKRNYTTIFKLCQLRTSSHNGQQWRMALIWTLIKVTVLHLLKHTKPLSYKNKKWRSIK